jgi:hypothetical protein
VKKSNHQWNEVRDASRVAMSALSADSSILELREDQQRLAEIQLIAVAIILAIGIVSLPTADYWGDVVLNLRKRTCQPRETADAHPHTEFLACDLGGGAASELAAALSPLPRNLIRPGDGFTVS